MGCSSAQLNCFSAGRVELATAEKKLAEMRDEAMANLNDVATEAAQETVKQLIGVKATKAEVTKQVKAAAKAANA